MPLTTVEPTRLYRQIADQIATLIDHGEFAAGARLPAERELASRARRIAHVGARSDHLPRARRPRRSARRHRASSSARARRRPRTVAPTDRTTRRARSTCSRRARSSKARSPRSPRARSAVARSPCCTRRWRACAPAMRITRRATPPIANSTCAIAQATGNGALRAVVEPAVGRARGIAVDAHRSAFPHAGAARAHARGPRRDHRRARGARSRRRARRDAPASRARRARIPAPGRRTGRIVPGTGRSPRKPAATHAPPRRTHEGGITS